MISPTIWNFLSQGRAVMMVPSPGVDPLLAKKRISEGGIPEAEIDALLRICAQREAGLQADPSVLQLEGRDIWEDYHKCLEAAEGLAKEGHGPILNMIGAISLANRYGSDRAINVLGIEATKTRMGGGLMLLLLKPCREDLRGDLGAMADVHLRIMREHGALLLRGIKPRTHL
ncbi:MAG: hypothetical protein QXK34_02985, partial [Candidatus Bathyarchaeia archaeon]